MFTDLGQAVPSETMCREHVHELAESEQGRIKELLMDKKVFLVVDESEIDKKKYLNVLVGDINVPEKTYLHQTKSKIILARIIVHVIF